MGAADSCRDAARLASEAGERSLTMRERVDLQAHMLICVACRNYRHQLRSLQRMLRSQQAVEQMVAPEVRLPPASRQRILAALNRSSSTVDNEKKSL